MGDIHQLIEIKKWIEEHRGICELGFACVKGVKPSGPSLGMVRAVEGFLLYHAAPGQRLLQDHFNFTACTENFIIVSQEHKELEVWHSVVEMFSRPGDWILDVNTPQVAGAAAAMKEGRNVLCLTPNEEEARNVLRKIL
ncbi:uncharacterized protein LOC114541929 [Dendronephthya gigantea]|uniref:uncharacterized protein LOC114541929 n=1 Tax=Dendronephthya gigantea TaxID=151771 RepID=UPI00106D4196|nr:uncharacterized protein LOC114541929 [Dendronephthya gigantea]